MALVEDIAVQHKVPMDNLLVQYLVRKTKAADRGSKARRSLGNLYALYVLVDDFLNGRTSRFTDLLARMKAMPFGAKLQNHPLDNRLNDEFARQTGVGGELLPIEASILAGQKIRRISVALLKHNGADPYEIAKFVISAIDAYVGQITANQSSALEEMDAIESIEDLQEFFQEAFAPNSDARLFEIASFVLLSNYFQSFSAYIGETPQSISLVPVELFRAGRTNANDGGIDFILKPYGRIFQVTETLDFRKYFLDFEKVNRYPISFVIKARGERDAIKQRIETDAIRSGRYNKEIIQIYMSLFEEIFTLNDLEAIAERISQKSIEQIKNQLKLQFQLEYGLLD